ncbi:hypothetical protein BHM03_00027390 [Ensete ventricosum]|nr:hypothetical protein BHM03_00027390 [Ensete ventricosum]
MDKITFHLNRGLTDFVFLPTDDAIVIQVVPQGKLDWIAINFYAEPAMGMKLRYLQCDISVEESTLKEAYSRDQRQRWFIYLRQQDVELDVNRCRPIHMSSYSSLVPSFGVLVKEMQPGLWSLRAITPLTLNLS